MMISKIQKDFLLLFQCIVDFGAEVLRDFTEEKIKIKYKTENFSIFLENTRHYLYHQWEKTKVPCCQCPVHGFKIPKTGRMDKTIYNKLYSFNSSEKCPKGHVIKKDSIIVQTCICRFTAGNIIINELDLSDLNALLVGLRAINTPMICKSEEFLINDIMIVRGTVCHAVTTTKFSEPELISLWAKFTNALYKLCPGDKKNVKWLKKTIETTKKTILSEEEVQELMGKIDMQERDVQDISEEVKKIMIDNTADLKNCVINESAGIKAHFDSTLQPFTDKQERHSELLLDQIKKSEERIIGRLEHMLGSHPVFARAFLSDLRTEPVIERADQRKIAIKGKITQESMTKTNEDNVIRTLPAEIDVTYEDIEEYNEKRQIMNINATKAKSIELELEVTAGIFKNAEVLRMAILTLVKEVVVAAKSDASKEDPIHILLTFESPLTEEETVTVTDLFLNTHQNGNQSHNDIVMTIDASSSCSSSSYSEFGSADETVTVTDFVMNTTQSGNQSQGDNSSGTTSSYLEVGNAESSFTKDPKESILPKKNETSNYLEKLQGLAKKAEEVTRLLLEKHVTSGKNLSSLLMRHKHSIYHLYDRNPCCQCSAVIPKESGVRSLRKNEFEGMFAKQRVKCKFRQKKSTKSCICFWNARKDASERSLPFPVIIYLLDYSSVTHNYERQLNRMKSTLFQINKLGQRLETIDFYKIWKSLGDDILYMAYAISTHYRETIEIDIKSFRPNLSTFELSVLDFMNEMNTTITDGLSKFQTNASLEQGFSKDFGNQILDLRRYIGTEVQDLKADIGRIRKIQDSKEMTETQKPLSEIVMEKHEELQYEKQNYKSVEPHVPLKERQLSETIGSKHWQSERTTEMERMADKSLNWEKAFIKNTNTIVKGLANPDAVATELYSMTILNDEMFETIKQIDELEQKTRKLLHTLNYRGKQGVTALHQAFIKTDNKGLAEILAPYVKEIEERENKTEPESWPPNVKEENIMLADPLIKITDPKSPWFIHEYGKEYVYKIQGKCRGQVFIINNVIFDNTKDNREASNKDATNLSKLFKDLHFDVIRKDNLTGNDMKSFLQSEAEQIEKEKCTECVVLIIMSHGGGTSISGVDHVPVELKTLIAFFSSDNCPSLHGKPRLVFVQVCRTVEQLTIDKTVTPVKLGGEGEIECIGKIDKPIFEVVWEKKDIETVTQQISQVTMGATGGCDETDLEPFQQQTTGDSSLKSTFLDHPLADFLVAYATPEGSKAWRHYDVGSWFMNAIVWTFKYHAHEEELHHLLIRVNRLVAKRVAGSINMTVAEVRSNLRKKFYFFPGIHGDLPKTF